MFGLDCNFKLTYETALYFRKLGKEFVMRYVGRLIQSQSLDIDKKEKDDILLAGLSLGLVQHCPPSPGIIPSRELGITYGKNAALFAQESEYEQGKILYLDLEDISPEYSTQKQKIYDYCKYWYDNVYKIYTPGVYIGFDVYLTSEELYRYLPFKYYWRSFSNVPDIYKRGYSMVQGREVTVNGMKIDPDEAQFDHLGFYPPFMQPKKVLSSTIRVYTDGTVEIANT